MVRSGWLLLLAAFLLAGPARADGAAPLRVFAAASMQESLDAAAKLWTGRSGQPVVVSYAGSSALARQIEQADGGHLGVAVEGMALAVGHQREIAGPQRRESARFATPP